MKKFHRIGSIALAAAAALASVSALAVTVNSSYLNTTIKEIYGHLGKYTNPTVYWDRYACGESSLSAWACSANTISVGSAWLQGNEKKFGNYVTKEVIAHEWGHTIQYAKGINKKAPMQELQADCVGGTFVKYAETTLKYPSFISASVATARYYADYGVHGTPSQRDYYTRYGYAKSMTNCLAL